MSSAIAQPCTPADLETRLAALGIPVARLIAAAGIGRSTWRDWRAGRTRPRPDRWAATAAAFDAIVAAGGAPRFSIEVREDAPAPADVEAPAAEPIPLTGSSVPTGAPPSFAPIASASEAEPSPSDVGRGGPAVALEAFRSLVDDMDRYARARAACEMRTVWPPVPDALFNRPEDDLPFLHYVARYEDGRRWYPSTSVESLRALTFEGRFIDPGGRSRRRRDAIVAASEAWQRARAAASMVSGMDAADAACCACAEGIVAMRDAVLDVPASSILDVLAKAAMFAWWHHDAGGIASDALRVERSAQLAAGNGSLPFVQALAVLADVVALAEARGMMVPSAEPVRDTAPPRQAVA